MAQHTPGPWCSEHRANDPGRKWSGTHHAIEAAMVGRVGVVADTLNRDCVIDPEEDRANARLIAAAPELLTELRDFHDHTIDQGWHECDGIPGGCPVAAAIAKAEGRP